jgi:hypothetical protein
VASISIDRAQLQRAFQDAAMKWANEMGRRVVNEAKARAPVDTGRLRSSIGYTIELTPSSCILKVGADVPYARYIEEGTGVHGPEKRRIRPTTKKALKFPTPHAKGPHVQGSTGRGKQADRGFLIRRSVAGIPANPYLKDALSAVFGAAARPTR